MIIKVFITDYHRGKIQMPRRNYEKHTGHGAMSCRSGILLDDPLFIDEDCIETLETVVLFAEKNNINYKIYNVKKDWFTFSAWIHGVKNYPTVIIGNKRIEAVPKIEDLEVLLN